MSKCKHEDGGVCIYEVDGHIVGEVGDKYCDSSCPAKIECPFCTNGTVLQYKWIDNKTKGRLIDSYPCDDCHGTGKIFKDMFTCNECKDNKSCPCAWDCYNTNGDCLASK